MKKSIFKVLAVGLAAAVAVGAMGGCKAKTSSTAGDQSWENIKSKGTLIVGTCAMYKPFEFKNTKTNELEGFDIDLMNQLGKNLGVKVEFKDAEFVSLLGGVGKGDYDIIASGMPKTKAATGNVLMSDSYYSIDAVIVTLKDNTSVNSVDDLKGKTIGVQSGGSMQKFADGIKDVKELKLYNYNADAFQDLRAKRIDAIIIGYPFAVLEGKQKSDIRVVDGNIGSTDIVLTANLKSEALIKVVNDEIKKMKDDGTYQEISDKWFK